MAEWRSRADEILAVDLAQGHAFAGSRRQGQIALAHRTRLRGAERRTRISSLRRSRLAWLSPPRDTLHRSLRLPDLRTGSDSPLSLLAAQDASVTQRFSTPWRRRSGPNVTSKTRSRRSENISPSRSQKLLCDVHAVKQCTARQLSISVHDAVELTSCSVRTNSPQTAEVGSAPAAACGAAAGGRVGRADNATRPRMRCLLRKSVIFFAIL